MYCNRRDREGVVDAGGGAVRGDAVRQRQNAVGKQSMPLAVDEDGRARQAFSFHRSRSLVSGTRSLPESLRLAAVDDSKLLFTYFQPSGSSLASYYRFWLETAPSTGENRWREASSTFVDLPVCK